MLNPTNKSSLFTVSHFRNELGTEFEADGVHLRVSRGSSNETDHSSPTPPRFLRSAPSLPARASGTGAAAPRASSPGAPLRTG